MQHFLHLISQGNRVSFEAIADIGVAVKQQGEVLWVSVSPRRRDWLRIRGLAVTTCAGGKTALNFCCV